MFWVRDGKHRRYRGSHKLEGFAQLAATLRERAEEQEALAMFNPSVADASAAFVPCDATLYCARRRAQRLPFAVWAELGAGDDERLQEALEAPSTTERLRMATRRLRELRPLD